jgi:hypothetical protein
MKRLTTTALLLVVAVASADAQACGEVMYRMGGALRYHAFVTKHPAQILLYADSSAHQASGADVEGFHRNLERAGHKVTIINTPDALARTLATNSYDVIIAYAIDLPAINSQLAHVSHEPTLIPVLQRGDENALREHYPLALNEDANLNQFLKTIEQTMKARGT